MARTTLEGQTRELLAQLKATRKRIQAENHAKLLAVDKEIEAVSLTLSLLQKRRTAEAVPDAQAFVPKSTGLTQTHRQALIEIAQQRGGTVRIVEAIPLLIDAGVIKSKRHAWSILYSTLTRSKEFKKIEGGGTFRLTTVNGSQPQFDPSLSNRKKALNLRA